MRRLAIPRQQTKALAVSRTVRHAQIGGTFGDLLLRGAEGVGTRAIRHKFPAHDARSRKPAAQLGDDLGRRHQLNEQLARPAGNFIDRLDFGEFAGFVGRENFSERKIADRRRVKNRIHFFG